MDLPIRTLPRDEWPHLLHEIPDPPKKLFLRGTLPSPTHKVLAVVGSRAVTAYGKDVTKKLISGLSGYPVTIVSGLAIGIDGMAHEAALDAALHTVSVPGSGIDDTVIYPARHRYLARRILESGGALLSEFEPTFQAAPWSFPARNRIMAGMSHAVLVVEARERSGTLITSRLATEYNRDVATVPGSIFSENSSGPHMLMRLGATPVTSSHDLLELLGFETDSPLQPTLPELTEDEHKVFKLLIEPLHKDELTRRLGLPTHVVSVLVSLLELKGIVRESSGMVYRC